MITFLLVAIAYVILFISLFSFLVKTDISRCCYHNNVESACAAFFILPAIIWLIIRFLVRWYMGDKMFDNYHWEHLIKKHFEYKKKRVQRKKDRLEEIEEWIESNG